MTIEQMERDSKRYSKLKSLNPQQYMELYRQWLQSEGISFDQKLDEFDVTIVEKPLDDIYGEPLRKDLGKF